MTKETVTRLHAGRTTEDTGMIYVYPCIKCGYRTGSLTDAPTTCFLCDGHAYVPSWWSHEDKDRSCEICDIAEDEHN